MNIVLNKITLDILQVKDTSFYSTSDWIHNPDLSNVEGVDRKYWKLVGSDIVEMDQSEKDVVDNSYVENIKLLTIQDIDAKTDALILNGAYYDGHYFSLTNEAQMNWNSLFTLMVAGTIPVTASYEVSTLDDGKSYILTPEKRQEFFGTIFQTVSYQIQYGRSLKVAVSAMSSSAQIEEFVDPR